MKHTTRVFCVWLPTQKKQQQQHRQRKSACFTEKEGMKGGVAKTGTRKDLKKLPRREPAERREPLIFFLFLHFLFLGSETVGTTTPHTRIFSTQKKKTKHKAQTRIKHRNYVSKTYGRYSRSQEISTGRESRDRCHLLRARIRHADVD